MTAVEIAALLSSGRFDLSDEKACQAEIHQWLIDRVPEGSVVEREPRLGDRDIPDFRVGRVFIEVKMNSAQPRAVVRQLERYARHPTVGALILLSNRAIALPATVGGKPLFNVSLGKAWL